jgi:hypothetical protein
MEGGKLALTLTLSPRRGDSCGTCRLLEECRCTSSGLEVQPQSKGWMFNFLRRRELEVRAGS